MATPLAVRIAVATAEDIAAWSRASLDAPLAGDAELWVLEASSCATVLGAFERAASEGAAPFVWRGSGGPTVLVGPGTLYVGLRLANADALTPCAPSKLVNRYVRPLLRGLTRAGATAHYFGRDWVSVEHRPAAWVGFAHDSTSQRAALEAFVGVTTPFAGGGRSSFLGKAPLALAALPDRSIGAPRVAKAIVDAYATAYGRVPDIAAPAAASRAIAAATFAPSPAWRATIEEAIGTVGAGPDGAGRLRLGGALLASRDALAEAETRAAAIGPDRDALGAMVDAVFGASTVALDGVRSRASLRDVLLRALTA